MSKPGKRCTVCAHKARHQIEIGLTHRVPAHALAERFGLSKDSIRRHARNHLSPAQRAAILTAQRPSAIDLEKLQASETEGLLANLVASRARLQSHAELAADLGDVRGAVSAEAQIIANLTLVAKLHGQLVSRHQVSHTSLLVSPDYLKVRAALLDALRPYPDAARAVSQALYRLESDAAKDITAAAGKVSPDVAPQALVIDAEPVQRTIPPPPC